MAYGFVGVAPGTTTIQLENGEVLEVVNWVDSLYWGTAEWQTGDTASISVFSAALSQSIPGGTRPLLRVDTNIPRSGDNGLPQAHQMYIYAFSQRYRRAARAASTSLTFTDYSNQVSDLTIFDLNRKTYNEFKYNGRVYAQGLYEDFPGGAGTHWQGTSSNTNVANNGVPTPAARASMILPVWLREGLGYSMLSYPEAALTIAQAAADDGTVLSFCDTVTGMHGLIQKNV